MFELTYRSKARSFINQRDISDILSEAEAFNAAHSITGCLVWHQGCFVQILEGEKEIVQMLYGKISTDARHKDVLLLNEGEKQFRSFEHWSMAFHEANENSLDRNDLALFENNLTLLSRFIEKPTTTLSLFWINVRKIIENGKQNRSLST